MIVSNPFIPVPPPTYGGLERVVFDLAVGLHELGLDVAVACPSESKLPRGVEHINIGPSKYSVQQNWIEAEKEAYEHYRPRLGDFGIIHDHSWYGWPYIAKMENPSLSILHTHHGHLNWKTPPPFRYPNLVGISQYMAATYNTQLGVATRCVYNGVALEDYPFNESQGTRLICLGRMAKFKQPHVALDVAKRAGIPIDVVGGDRFVDDFEYVKRVKEMCEDNRARYVGEVTHEVKLEYLRNSRALLVCSRMGEPFGLVAVEALSCGRPVICLNDGALGEIVAPSAGFVCQTPDEMVTILKSGQDRLIKPEDCRRRAEQFSKQKMSQEYEKLYKDILRGDEW